MWAGLAVGVISKQDIVASWFAVGHILQADFLALMILRGSSTERRH